MTDIQLDERIDVRGVGKGWIAVINEDRVSIEFADEDHSEIVVPTKHIGTPLYERTGEMFVSTNYLDPVKYSTTED